MIENLPSDIVKRHLAIVPKKPHRSAELLLMMMMMIILLHPGQKAVEARVAIWKQELCRAVKISKVHSLTFFRQQLLISVSGGARN